MIPRQKLLSRVKEKLKERSRNVNQAAVLAYELCMLKTVYGDQDYTELLNDFRSYIASNHFEDLLVRQMDYLLRLIEYEGKLEYEEVSKVFSLCDEIEALRHLGFSVDETVYLQYESSLRSWLKREPRAHNAAQSRVDDWKKHWWWYQ